MNTSMFRHLERWRVRWAEVDSQAIVFNGHYLMYADTAVAGYWRSMVLPYAETLGALSGDLFVRKATVEYEAPARYDEMLEVGVRCERVGRSSMTLQAGIFRDQRLLAKVELIYVFADPQAHRSQAIPEALTATLLAFERGESMLSVASGSWDELGPRAAPLRHSVFVVEQGISPDLENDGADARSLHVLATNRMGLTVGTGRLLPLEDGRARIGRMAVHTKVRGGGVGRSLLDALISMAAQRGYQDLVLHAQSSAVKFYERAGFKGLGSPFEEAGISHQEMVLRL